MWCNPEYWAQNYFNIWHNITWKVALKQLLIHETQPYLILDIRLQILRYDKKGTNV